MHFHVAGITGIVLGLVIHLLLQPFQAPDIRMPVIASPPMLCTQVDIGVPCSEIESGQPEVAKVN